MCGYESEYEVESGLLSLPVDADVHGHLAHQSSETLPHLAHTITRAVDFRIELRRCQHEERVVQEHTPGHPVRVVDGPHRLHECRPMNVGLEDLTRIETRDDGAELADRPLDQRVGVRPEERILARHVVDEVDEADPPEVFAPDEVGRLD